MLGLFLMLAFAPTPALAAAPVSVAAADPDIVTLGTVGGRPITDGQFEFAARTRPSTWTEAETRGRVMALLVDETILYLEGKKAGFEDRHLVRKIMGDAMFNDERGKSSRAEYLATLKPRYKVKIDQAVATSFDATAEPAAVVARVNDVPVRVEVWGKKPLSRMMGKAPAPPDRATLVQDAIDEEILFQEAKRVGYSEDYRVVRALVQQYKQHALGLDVRATDEQLKARYDADPSEFGVPEKRHVLRLFVKTTEKRDAKKTRKLVENLRAQIVAHPSEFEDVAGIWTDDLTTRKRNGDLGWIDAEGRANIPRATTEAAFTMRSGEVSPIRDVDGGLEILLVRDVRPAAIRPFESVILDVEGAVRVERSASRYEAFMAPLRASYPTVIDEAAVAKLPIPPGRRRGR